MEMHAAIEALRPKLRTAISNAYYDARNAGLTMETAADSASSVAVDVFLGALHDGLLNIASSSGLDVERLAQVRLYVENNRNVWSADRQDGSSAAMLSWAYTDIYQKVLNVIDTGDPLALAPSEPEP